MDQSTNIGTARRWLAIGLAGGLSALPLFAEPLLASEDEAATFSAYEPSPAYPFGQSNPDAPDAVNDYAFMVGDWVCDERRRQDGEWLEYPSSMRGQYYLNGYGLINFTWTPTTASSMSYIYDAGQESWTITNTSSSQAAHSIWTGQRDGEDRIASSRSVGPDGQPVDLQITFNDITESSFSWRLEVETVAGPYVLRTKTCSRVNNW